MKKFFLTLFLYLTDCRFCLHGSSWVIVFRENVSVDAGTRATIPTGSDFEDLTDTLRSTGVLRSERNFIITSRLKSYGRNVKPGS